MDLGKIAKLEVQLSQHKFMVAALMRDKHAFKNMCFLERLLFLFTRTIMCEKEPVDKFYDKIN